MPHLEGDEPEERTEHVVLIEPRSHRQERTTKRRSNDRLIDTALKYGPLAAMLATLFGVRLLGPSADIAAIGVRMDKLEKRVDQGDQRDSTTIVARERGRSIIVGAASKLARVVCGERTLTNRSIDAGIPCVEITTGHDWELFKTADGLGAFPRIPVYNTIIARK